MVNTLKRSRHDIAVYFLSVACFCLAGRYVGLLGQQDIRAAGSELRTGRFPPTLVTSVDGDPYDLELLSGLRVILIFGGSNTDDWLPLVLSTLQITSDVSDQSLQVVLIVPGPTSSLDRATGAGAMVLLDGNNTNARRLGIREFPHIFLLDKSMKIVASRGAIPAYLNRGWAHLLGKLGSGAEIQPSDRNLVAVGDRLPPFTGLDPQGTHWTSDELAGREFVLVHFLSTCEPCDDLIEELASCESPVVMISPEGRDAVSRIRKYPTSLVTVLADEQHESGVFHDVQSFPTVFEVDAAGLVLQKMVGYNAQGVCDFLTNLKAQ